MIKTHFHVSWKQFTTLGVNPMCHQIPMVSRPIISTKLGVDEFIQGQPHAQKKHFKTISTLKVMLISWCLSLNLISIGYLVLQKPFPESLFNKQKCLTVKHHEVLELRDKFLMCLIIRTLSNFEVDVMVSIFNLTPLRNLVWAYGKTCSAIMKSPPPPPHPPPPPPTLLPAQDSVSVSGAN